MTADSLNFWILAALFVLVFWVSMNYLERLFPSRILIRLKQFTQPNTPLSNSSPVLPAQHFHSFLLNRMLSYGMAMDSMVQYFIFAPRRRRRVLEDLPNALDLWCICMEAGLTLEAALSRVASEMNRQGAPLGQELHYLSLSLNAGLSKETAFRKFANRLGGEQVHALVSLLIQAERFGTSIVRSLTAHAEMMREQKRQRAQESASKVGLKLLFPLTLCHLPALFIVLLGPACIQLYRTLSPLWSAVSS